jgi:quinoprotein glucose dehydrogenase
VFSVDEALGMVYMPLGNQVPDQLGMGRSENVEKFSSSIVALDINTGQLKWVRSSCITISGTWTCRPSRC